MEEETTLSAEMREKRVWQRDSLVETYRKLARHFGLPRNPSV